MDGPEFERAVRDHGDAVYSYAAWLTRRTDEARDVVQEAYLRLWTRRSAVEPDAARPWLLRTAYRICVDRSRRNRSRPLSGEAHFDDNPGPEQQSETSELRGTVVRILDEMSLRDRALLVMREMQGATYEEMAEVLELPLGTLKAALHRARERLRAHLLANGVRP